MPRHFAMYPSDYCQDQLCNLFWVHIPALMESMDEKDREQFILDLHATIAYEIAYVLKKQREQWARGSEN